MSGFLSLFSKMKVGSGSALILALSPVSVAAQEPRNEHGNRIGPTQGCYERVYSEAELAKSPAQVIAAMRVRVFLDQDSKIKMRFAVRAADQGGAAKRGMGNGTYWGELDCAGGYKAEFPFCYAYCDGGRMTFPKDDGQQIVFSANSIKLPSDGGCDFDKNFDLIGWRDKKVSYRINRVADATCQGM